jgi:hypothetical protein
VFRGSAVVRKMVEIWEVVQKAKLLEVRFLDIRVRVMYWRKEHINARK